MIEYFPHILLCTYGRSPPGCRADFRIIARSKHANTHASTHALSEQFQLGPDVRLVITIIYWNVWRSRDIGKEKLCRINRYLLSSEYVFLHTPTHNQQYYYYYYYGVTLSRIFIYAYTSGMFSLNNLSQIMVIQLKLFFSSSTFSPAPSHPPPPP